ncbi:hypothetical protein [Streptomyces sp. TRM68367]|uniref:hypothetical protein n=1 Tax=Streptomyces sp. TRM68367 TaxID=2758415 RepID=UPI00165BA63C|nr:hypothetical protein [Streptomyces sp. TRM68367]MBC9731580.1 hypothetical protein [Streptomyces sp. TRM68367]
MRLGPRRFDLDLLGSLDARTKESVGSAGEGWDCPQYLPAASAPRRPHPQRLELRRQRQVCRRLGR